MHTNTSRCALALGFSLLSSACRSAPPAEWGGGAGELEAAPRLERTSTEQAAPSETLSTPEDATLEFYLELAMRESHRLRAAHERWSAALQRVPQARTWAEPTLSYTEFLEEVQTRTGPQQRRFSLSQALPRSGLLDAREELARRQADELWHVFESERLALGREVALLHNDYSLLGRELELRRELLALLHGLEPVVQARVRAGAGQEDILRLQVEIGRLEDVCAQLERRRPALSAALAAAIGLPRVDVSLPLPTLLEPSPGAIDVHASVERALANNPGLRALEAELGASHAQRELASLRQDPGLSLGVDYIQTGEAIDPDTPGSSDDPLALRISMSIPLWQTSYRAGELEARHVTRAVRAALDDELARLWASIEEEAFRSDDAQRRLALFRDSLIPRAEESLQLTLANYRAGGATLLDLIDSERSLLEFELSYWRACRDALSARARLKALVGGVAA